MRTKHLFLINLTVIGVLWASAPPARAQVGTAMTYQGRLADTGVPVDDTADFDFKLYDAEAGGTQVGATTVLAVPVVGGLFNVDLDFGAGTFQGDARWLEITVQLQSGGGWIPLSPRQAIRPAPYALYALDGAGGSGESPWIDHTDGIYYSAGNVGVGATPSSLLSLKITAGDGEYALYAYSPDTAAGTTINAESDVPGGRAVWGQASGEGTTYGVGGYAESPTGFGVFGDNQYGMGDAVGVFGRTNSPTGFGGYFVGKGYFSGNVGIGTETPASPLTVAGLIESTLDGFKFPDGTIQSTASVGGGSSLWTLGVDDKIYYNDGFVGIGTANPNFLLHVASAQRYGIYGETSYSTGRGVQGVATHTTGSVSGVLGVTNSTAGRGVFGAAQASTGTTTGVLGEAYSPDGYGVWGYNDADSGNFTSVGVYGSTAAPRGVGVKGYAPGPDAGYGLWGRAAGASGRGVFAEATAATGYTIGLEAYVASPTGYGVYAFNEAESGDAIAIQGDTNSPDGFGGYFRGKGHFSGNVGIGTDSPTEMLDVVGTAKMDGFQLTTAPTTGYVLTSDASGVGTWQAPSGGGSSPWQDCATGIWYEDGNAGVGAEDPTSKLQVWTDWQTSAFKAETTRYQAGVTSVGVWGEASSIDAIGVRGLASATTGTTYGGYFTSASDDGYGVWGHNESAGVFNYQAVGVYGSSDSTEGVGVKGYVPGPQGVAVWGRAAGTNSRAVHAQATASSGITYGLEAYAASPDGYAVYAVNEADTGNAIAIRGGTNSPSGFAGYFDGQGYFSSNVGIGTTTPTAELDVAGTVKMTGVQLGASATPGHVLTTDAGGVGTWQELAASQWEGAGGGGDIYYTGEVGIGTTDPLSQLHVIDDGSYTIRAVNESTWGFFSGLFAEVESPNGRAVKGVAKYTSTPGDAVGVFGESFCPGGSGVRGKNLAGGYGVYGRAETGGGWAGYFWGRGYFSDDVGIGLEDPEAKLHVVADGSAAIKAVNESTTGAASGVFGESSSPDGYGIFGRNLAGGYGVYGEGNTADGGWAGFFYGRGFFSGDVGIGTDAPDAKLDVNGTVKMNGLQLGTSSTSGYVLTCDSSGVGTWQESTGSTFDLPYSGSVSSTTAAMSITNTGSGMSSHAIMGVINNANSHADAAAGYFHADGAAGNAIYALSDRSSAVEARHSGSNLAFYGSSSGSGAAQFTCSSENGYGVKGRAGSLTGTDTYGGWFETASDVGKAVYAYADGDYATGVWAITTGGESEAIHAESAYTAIYATGINAAKLYGDLRVFERGTSNLVFHVDDATGVTSVEVLHIMGGADLAENFEVTEPDVQPGMVVEIDPENPGKLRIASGAYNRRVAGVVSGANDLAVGMVLGELPGAENAMPIALSGRVWVYCDATERAIEPGDMLTTAERPGHAMPVLDHSRAHGTVIGKAMSKLAQGETGLVLVLVNLQ